MRPPPRSHYALRAPVRWLSTEPAADSTRQAESAAPTGHAAPTKQSLILDFAAKPSATEQATFEGAGEQREHGDAAGGASGTDLPRASASEGADGRTSSWPPRPENETVVITFREPWLAALAVLAVLAAIEYALLTGVVGSDGEKKIFKKIEERRADARMEPSAISLLDALKAPPPPAAPK